MTKKNTKYSMKKSVKRILVFGLFSVCIIFFVMLTVYNVVTQIVDKYKEADELEQKMIVLSNKEEELNNEIIKLQDKDYLARYAREKYFYSKNGELIIRIPTEN